MMIVHFDLVDQDTLIDSLDPARVSLDSSTLTEYCLQSLYHFAY